MLRVSDLNLPHNATYVNIGSQWTANRGAKSATAPRNSLVIPKRGGAIGTNKKRILARDCILDPNLMAIHPHDGELDVVYLYHWFKTFDLLDISSGSAVPQLNKQDLRPLRLPLPPIDEQRRISATLDQAGMLLTKRRQAVSLLDDLTQSIFVDMFGDPRSNPYGWPVKNLGLLGQVQGGLQVTAKRKSLPLEVPYLRVANVYRNRLDLQEIKTIKVTGHELERTRLRKADLLVVEGHGNPEEIGRVAQWDGSIADCVHQNHLIRVRLGDAIFPDYACALLNSQGGRVHLLRSANTTSGLNTISSSDVRAVPVILPPLRLQAEFVAKIDRVRQLQDNQEKSLRALDELFGSLQARAFSGEL